MLILRMTAPLAPAGPRLGELESGARTSVVHELSADAGVLTPARVLALWMSAACAGEAHRILLGSNLPANAIHAGTTLSPMPCDIGMDAAPRFSQ